MPAVPPGIIPKPPDPQLWANYLEVKKFKLKNKVVPESKEYVQMNISAEQLELYKKQLIESLEFNLINKKTWISVVVTDIRNHENNTKLLISCKSGKAFSRGYAYMADCDSYVAFGVEAMELGSIPIGYEMRMKEIGNWNSPIPIPLSVAENFFTSNQKKLLSSIKERWGNEGYFKIDLLQMTSHDN